jgi:CheY-like chemotaxis protein
MQKSKRVIYIEDEPELIDLVRLILNRKGYEVHGANGGREGLELVAKELPDLVLLDLMMPDMDGWDVYQKMKADQATQDIPRLLLPQKHRALIGFLTAYCKADDYISKPFSLSCSGLG